MKRLILLFLAILGLSSITYAEEQLTLQELSVEVQKLASEISGIAITDEAPDIILIDTAAMKRIMCHQYPCSLGVPLAFYDWKTKTIFIDAQEVDLNTREGLSVLVHEMVHHLRQTGPEKYSTVAGCIEEESTALDAQQTFFRLVGIDMRYDPSRVRLLCGASFGE